jgi:hypothetical protein
MSLTTEQQAQLDYLKQLVALRVDEYSESASNIGDDDINYGDIEFELDKSARKVLTSVDRFTILDSSVRDTTLSPVDTDDGYGSILALPADFLRFVSLKYSEWNRNVTGLISDDTSAYQQQQFSMRRGRNDKPKAFIVPYHEAQSGVVPTGFILVEVTEASAPNDLGDTFANVDPDSFVLTDLNGPIENHFWAYVTAGAPAVGETFTEVDAPTVIREVIVRYTAGQSFNSDSSNKAIESYPKGTSPALTYVPALKSYDMPENLEDALVWHTVYRVLVIAGRNDSAGLAFQEYQKVLVEINNGFKGEENGER